MKVQMRELFYRGFMISDSRRTPIEDEIPKDCYGYRIIERTEMKGDDGEFLTGEWKQVGKQVIFGKVLTVAEVLAGSILYDNMVTNGWDRVVRTRSGNVILFSNDMDVMEQQEVTR